VDLFAGCGGLTAGLKRAGFKVESAVEIDDLAVSTYASNHPEVTLLHKDIVEIQWQDLIPKGGGSIDLVAGCPPCQGFSRVRRHNRSRAAKDPRNSLIGEFRRIVEQLEPAAVFVENVPGIERDGRFHAFLARLREMGYTVNWDTLELSDYGVPQWRSRVVVLAGKGFAISMPRRGWKQRTVRDAIGGLPSPGKSRRPLHNQITRYSKETVARIRAVPKNGGSRSDWPDEFQLECHEECDGFRDVYGRMWWHTPAPTITGGCINASKGRFLHPAQHRAITLFEAALLQSFSRRYRFDLRRGRYAVAEMIGNALPPVFSERVGRRIIRALENRGHG
jgi:DNA (cytosine-5)-methyltransferase 1